MVHRLQVATLWALLAMASADDPRDFQVEFSTTPGKFTIQVHHEWAPLGAERFKQLVMSNYYDGASFFRTIPGFMTQFGINCARVGDTDKWAKLKIRDDPVVESNTRGRVTFAMSGPNTRTAQVFINFGDNSRLDGQGFAPFAEVISGIAVVSKIYGGYGEGAPGGRGPAQGKLYGLQAQQYLTERFPLLSYIRTAGIPAPVSMETDSTDEHGQPVVLCETTRGPFRMHLKRAWAPLGAARFEAMVADGYFERTAFYRVIPQFLTQFGIAGSSKEMRQKWNGKGPIMDDKHHLKGSFPRGAVSFAGSGPHSRTTQLFISYSKSSSLGNSPWETPFAVVDEKDMKNVIDKLYSGYGDMAPFNKGGVDYGRYDKEGNEYLSENFPSIDYIKSCEIEGAVKAAPVLRTGPTEGAELTFVEDAVHNKRPSFASEEKRRKAQHLALVSAPNGDIFVAFAIFFVMFVATSYIILKRRGNNRIKKNLS